jgi:hypothetical protein
MDAMELWYPPTDQPHLLEWWRPLILASRKARLRRVRWPIHIDEMVLVGRVDRGTRPAIWVYRHGEGRGELYVDGTGQTYSYTRTPKAKGHGRFTECELDKALWAAGFHHVVEPVWYDAPTSWSRHDVVPGPSHRPVDDHHLEGEGDVEPVPAPRRRGHLTVLDGGAHPKAG